MVEGGRAGIPRRRRREGSRAGRGREDRRARVARSEGEANDGRSEGAVAVQEKEGMIRDEQRSRQCLCLCLCLVVERDVPSASYSNLLSGLRSSLASGSFHRPASGSGGQRRSLSLFRGRPSSTSSEGKDAPAVNTIGTALASYAWSVEQPSCLCFLKQTTEQLRVRPTRLAEALPTVEPAGECCRAGGGD